MVESFEYRITNSANAPLGATSSCVLDDAVTAVSQSASVHNVNGSQETEVGSKVKPRDSWVRMMVISTTCARM